MGSQICNGTFHSKYVLETLPKHPYNYQKGLQVLCIHAQRRMSISYNSSWENVSTQGKVKQHLLIKMAMKQSLNSGKKNIGCFLLHFFMWRKDSSTCKGWNDLNSPCKMNPASALYIQKKNVDFLRFWLWISETEPRNDSWLWNNLAGFRTMGRWNQRREIRQRE